MGYTEIRHIAITPGTGMADAVTEAKAFALEKHCIVRFDFNGATVDVTEFTHVAMMVKRIRHKLGIESE